MSAIFTERWTRAPGGATYEPADPLLAQYLRGVIRARYAAEVALEIDTYRLRQAEPDCDGARDLVAAE